MKHYLSKYSHILEGGNNDSRPCQIRITVNKFNAFIFSTIIGLIIIYQLLFHQNRLNPTIIYLNNNSSFKFPIPKPYRILPDNKDIPEHISTIIDKPQGPAQCLISIRTADGAIGNRMFLFASAYGLARLHQCELYVAPWILTDLRSIFIVNITNTPVHLITNNSILNQTGIFQRYSACTLFTDLLKIPLNSNLTRYEMVGFYQAFGYFIKYRDELAYLFQFNQAAIRNNVPLVEQLLQGLN